MFIIHCFWLIDTNNIINIHEIALNTLFGKRINAEFLPAALGRISHIAISARLPSHNTAEVMIITADLPLGCDLLEGVFHLTCVRLLPSSFFELLFGSKILLFGNCAFSSLAFMKERHKAILL